MKYLIPLTVFLFFGCQSGSEGSSENTISLEDLKSEVLAIHDEVMPKMGELRRTRKDLMLQADSLAKTDSLKSEFLNALANDIGDASEGMMQWMRAYEPDFEGSDEEVRVYFEAQMLSIQEVKQKMESSLAEGKKVIGE